jgi:hypothetical protein
MSQTPQSLTHLFSEYLNHQMAAQAEGLGLADEDGLAVPHEAVAVQPVDPRLAWADATAVACHFPAAAAPARWAVPPDWPTLVAGQEPAVALAFCLGNYPQLVRNLQPLLSGGDLTLLRQSSGRPCSVPPALLEWAPQTQDHPQTLMAAAVLRLARRFEEAADLLRSSAVASTEWEAVRVNEEAALAWHAGRADRARSLWEAQPSSVPVLFNRGMASLFLGHTAEARPDLAAAADQLPETCAWYHLAHLYLALAEARA